MDPLSSTGGVDNKLGKYKGMTCCMPSCGEGVSDPLEEALESTRGLILNTVTNFFQGGSFFRDFLRDTQGRLWFAKNGSVSATWFRVRRASPEEERD